MQSNGDHRPDPPHSAAPIPMLEGFLDFLRSTLLWKIEGLTDEQVKRPLTASGVSLLGLVKHSAYVERTWFQIRFAGHTVGTIWSPEDPDADWRIEPDDSIESITRLYLDECAKSRDIVAVSSWDDPLRNPGARNAGKTLGWVLTHMVEEVARHCGHADILRELIDGATGE